MSQSRSPVPDYAVDLLLAAKEVLEWDCGGAPDPTDKIGKLADAVTAFEEKMPLESGVIQVFSTEKEMH